MTLAIWKFPLRITDVQEIEVPVGAKVLHVDEQHGNLYLWALVGTHPYVPKRKLRIAIVGTGDPAPHSDTADYIGTVITSGGEKVWHVFAKRA